ncbi:hypothetical protein LIER_33595 [Lithospermum erythrorhizon]|uniref:UBA domain-containing protein n=1 Tax=Lithospermum erythrorhizon TaxID=34254 RepID=A0AAV3RYL4_LITER
MGMGKLKVGGAWSGVLEVELDEWSVSMLRVEVVKRSGFENIKLICCGRVLKDGDGSEKLSDLGIKNNGKVLVTKVSVDDGNGKSQKDEFLEEEERSNRLNRIKAAATSLSKRHADGSLPVEDFNLELENQSGEKVQMGSETDQQAIMMGLMLHTNAKRLIKLQKYTDALEVLIMGEEAFSLCDPKLLEMVDNVPILQIDMVWCYFMLRDISWLSVAGMRLVKAREGLERAYGKEASRLRLLQGGRYPELALHVRLELLEGVVAYHTGQLDKSRQAFTSAQEKYFKLQVPDETLSALMSMGYNEREAKRALRMNHQDIERAVEFLVEDRERKLQKREEDIQRQRDIMEQKRYGTTPLKKAVDLQKLKQLVSIGYEKDLAAEALRRNENDTERALDDLTNPETNAAIQVDIESRKKKRLRQKADAAIEELTAMGFPRAAVVQVVRLFGNRDAALSYLLSVPNETLLNSTDGSIPSASVPSDNSLQNASGQGDTSLDTSAQNAGQARDVEMEDELTRELQKEDAFSDYDIEITKEGEAINEYLAMLTSGETSTGASS